MTLKEACEIAIDCGLTSTVEAYLNISLHDISLFAYDDIDAEIAELHKELNAIGDVPIDEYMERFHTAV